MRAFACKSYCSKLSRSAHQWMDTTFSNFHQLKQTPYFWHDRYVMRLQRGHRFPASRYETVFHTLHTLPFFSASPHFHESAQCSMEDLTRVHAPSFVRSYLDGSISEEAMKRIGFPWTEQLSQRTLFLMGGTVLGAELAWRTRGIAANLAGGTHHSYSAHGEGFCIFNDAAVAIRKLQSLENGPRRFFIIDLDVHQGNGVSGWLFFYQWISDHSILLQTAAIFRDDPNVFTFSAHGSNQYPFVKETSTMDVGLPDRCGDVEYLRTVMPVLQQSLIEFCPDFVLFQSGVDPLAEDRLGRLSLTRAGLRARNQLVFSMIGTLCRHAPCVVMQGGGYSQPIQLSADAHCDVWFDTHLYDLSLWKFRKWTSQIQRDQSAQHELHRRLQLAMQTEVQWQHKNGDDYKRLMAEINSWQQEARAEHGRLELLGETSRFSGVLQVQPFEFTEWVMAQSGSKS